MVLTPEERDHLLEYEDQKRFLDVDLEDLV